MDFSWLSDIFNGILKFVPRPIIVRTTHRGVAWRFGKYIREMSPGWRWVWPLITDWVIIVVARQTNKMPVQTIESKDGHQVSIGMYIVYRINDPIAAIGKKNWDVDTTVNDISQGVLVKTCSQFSYIELREKLTTVVADRLTTQCKKDLKTYGILVEKCAFYTFSKTEVRTIFGFQNQEMWAGADDE